MLDVVLVSDTPGCDELWAGFGVLGIDEPHFARLVIVDVDDDELPRLRLSSEAGVPSA